MELVMRTLRVAETGGVPALELGIPSLQQPVVATQQNAVAQVSESAPVVAAPAVAALDRSAVLDALVQLFAQHTGYEAADLDPAHQLEADLGIDTVKQAEIFSVVRERYSLAREENFKLSDVQTLNAIADYVVSRAAASAPVVAVAAQPVVAAPVAAPIVAEPVVAAVAPVPVAVAAIDQQTVLAELTAMFAQHTGYETADLDPTHQLEADLGIDTVKQAEIFSLVRERYSLAKDESFRLTDVQTLNAIAGYVMSRMGTPSTVAPVAPVPAGPCGPCGPVAPVGP
jgi:acyl carrier protein